MQSELNQKIVDFITQKKALETSAWLVKKDFKKYITNKEFPLLERWDCYLKAPSELKETKEYLLSPGTRFLEKYFEDRFDAPEVYGRGKTIYIKNLFQDLIWKGKVNLEEYAYRVPNLKEEEVFESMEELLELNLDYFTYDW